MRKTCAKTVVGLEASVFKPTSSPQPSGSSFKLLTSLVSLCSFFEPLLAHIYAPFFTTILPRLNNFYTQFPQP
jgi:hypothetical protein